MFKKNRAKKISLSILLSIFLFFNFFAIGMFRPQIAKAGFPVSVIESLPEKTADIKDQILDTLLSSALGSLINAASYFTRKLAYDAATYLADSAVGKKPAVFQESPGDYFANVALDSAASAIADFGKGVLGMNFCTPPDLNFQLSLQVGLSNIYSNEYGSGSEKGPQPSCSWNEMKSGWDNVQDKYSAAEIFNANLDVTQGGLGTVLVAKSNIDSLNAKATESANAERAEGDGFKAVKDVISGEIKTPAQTVKTESEAVGAKQQGEMSATQMAGMYAVSGWQIIPTAISTFANTFVSTLAQNILQDGLFPTSKESGKESVTNPYASVLNYNRKAVENAYSYLIKDLPNLSLEKYDYVSQFVSCPDEPANDNCVMDSSWQTVINRYNTGNPMTIKQAIDEGIINGNQIFYSEYSNENQTKDCYTKGLCYSNLQKMRKARIIPLGFEIVAEKATELGNPTLETVVNAYYTEGNYYGLINPNWIIKAPEARIKLKTYSSEILDGTNTRQEQVIDYDSCVVEDNNGKCEKYGYCLQEKNTWKFYGDSCEPIYNTCKTFSNNLTGDEASYLSRTLEYGDCNADAVGCQAYSLNKNDSGNWINSFYLNNDIKGASLGGNQNLFLNSKAEQYSCSSDANGCELFNWEKKEYSYNPETLETTSSTYQDQIHLKKAPDYLACYDVDKTTSLIEWPKSKADLLYLADRSKECEDFAGVCLPDEVGCASYTEVNSGEEIGGKVELQNWCPETCVGYDTFKQNASAFEDSVFPLYFIPSTAETCQATYAGCSEFTKVDEVGNGANSLVYFSDTKKCELPDGENASVFYSWEGSDKTGYVLKKHNLKKISSEDEIFIENLTSVSAEIKSHFEVGSPAYENDSSISLNESYNTCNREKYNKYINGEAVEDYDKYNCTALYDDAGNIFYRSLNKTITVSDQCSLYRKTDLNMYEDDDINNQNICLQKGGKWQNNNCLRCYDNGFYVDQGNDKGACEYYSIPEEARSCPASADGCRLYIGNTGNNLHKTFENDFEPAGDDENALSILKENWCENGSSGSCSQGDVDIKTESTYVGGHSLRVIGGTAYYNFNAGILFDNLNDDKWYELTFWAKGDIQNLNVYFSQSGNETYLTTDNLTSALRPLSINDEWQEYKLGPILVNGINTASVQLFFESNVTNKIFFLDNIRLNKVGDTADDRLAVIKDSWKTNLGYDVPEVCDNTPLDGFPGRYLGCSSYTVNSDTENDGSVINLTGFAKLCREDAIGCAKLQDTYNRNDDYGDEYYAVYNLFCNNSTGCVLDSEDNNIISSVSEFNFGFIKNPVFAKKIKISDSYDFYTLNIAGLYTKNLEIVTSTVVIPPTSEPVYLTLKNDHICNSDDIGCTEMGKESQIKAGKNYDDSYVFGDVFLLNKPELYSEILCNDSLVGCGSYSANNLISYFKDPVLAGNTLCEYKKVGNDDPAWYMSGVGSCKLDPPGLCYNSGDCPEGAMCVVVDAIGYCSYPSNMYCTEDSQCGEKGFCDKIGELPCGDLPSNGSAGYQGKVGLCDEENNGCTKFLDWADLNSDNQPKEYYNLYNDKLTSQTASCGGMVSQEQGCILLDREEYPNKLYNATSTYKNSRENDYNLVSPVSDTNNQSNLLIKVKIDRECEQYLECTSKTIEEDSDGNKVEVCANYKLQNKPDDDEKILDKNKYVERISEFAYPSWYDKDYTGYAFLNKRNLDGYKTIYLQDGNASRAYLIYESDNNSCKIPALFGSGSITKPDFSACTGKDGSSGVCYDGKCILPVDGKNETSFVGVTNEQDLIAVLSGDKIKENLYAESCKTFPEEDSPFDIRLIANFDSDKYIDCFNLNEDDEDSSEVSCGRYYFNLDDTDFNRTEWTKIKSKYDNANYYQYSSNIFTNPDDSVGFGSCLYTKVEYKDGTIDYWPLDFKQSNADYAFIPQGICSGIGEKTGDVCFIDTDCGEGGVCNKIEQQGTYYGVTGVCMEYDKSRGEKAGNKTYYPCLTWYYSDRSISQMDLYNYNPEAGYNPEGNPTEGNSDSNDFGQVFCLNSTEQGQTPEYGLGTVINGQTINDTILNNQYNLAFNRPVFTADCNDDYNSGECSFKIYNYFNRQEVAGLYFEAEEENTGGGGVVSDKYKEVINSNDEKQQYIMLNEWAKNIDTYKENRQIDLKNIRILRFDAVNDPYYTVLTNGIVKSFAPAVGQDSGEYGDVGTLIHPIRFNSSNLEITSSSYNSYNSGTKIETLGFYHDGNDSGDGEKASKFNLYNLFLSPNFKSFNGSNLNNSFIYISELENKIKEEEIAKIHIVPIEHISGAEGRTIGLLDAETFTIDFNKLRQSTNKILYAPVKNYCTGYNEKFCMASGSSTNSGLNFVSYLLEKENTVLFKNNSDFNFTYELYNDTGKNEIKTRYVGYFYSDSILNQNNSKTTLNSLCTENNCQDISLENTINKQSDPFYFGRGDSDRLNEEENATLLAIGLDFNEDGDFLGYISRFIDAHDNSDGESYGMRLAVIVELNSKCTEYGVLYDNNLLNNNTKPRTDILWSGKKGLDKTLTKNLKNATTYSDIYIETLVDSVSKIKNYSNAPFGSLTKRTDDVFKTETDLQNNKTTVIDFDRFYYFSVIDKSQIIDYDFETSGIPTKTNGLFKALDFTASDINPEYKQFTTLNEHEFITASFPNNTSFMDVFAAAYYKFDESKDKQAPGTSLIDHLSSGTGQTFFEKLYSINSPRIFGVKYDEINKKYVLGDFDNLSIDNITETSVNNSTGKKIIIKNSPFEAYLSFYAYADDDQMPIKTVILDTGKNDEVIGGSGTKGLFKNRKPYCDDEPNEIGRCSGTQITCKENSECANNSCIKNAEENFFGDATRACTPQPFLYSVKYECANEEKTELAGKQEKVGDITEEHCFGGPSTDTTLCTNLKNTLKKTYNLLDNDYYCYYQPKVQITDNWGYCNNGLYGTSPKECNKDNDKSFTKFNGYLVVLPENTEN
ncbi:MAG: hypothetical protein WC414_02025 [Patescibacteria group bacterium]